MDIPELLSRWRLLAETAQRIATGEETPIYSAPVFHATAETLRQCVNELEAAQKNTALRAARAVVVRPCAELDAAVAAARDAVGPTIYKKL